MKIALLGNPNTGKSSIFNMLTGLRQHVGNFPGVTVDKKSGVLTINNENHTLIDFPGTYSIYPRSSDEQAVYDVLSNPAHIDFPDVAVVVADESNLERNLFLFTQIYDLQIPTVLVLNMSDVAKKKGINIKLSVLQTLFPEAVVVETAARVGLGKQRLIDALIAISKEKTTASFLPNNRLSPVEDLKAQENEASERFKLIHNVIVQVETDSPKEDKKDSNRLDRILVHPVFGYLIFAALLKI